MVFSGSLCLKTKWIQELLGNLPNRVAEDGCEKWKNTEARGRALRPNWRDPRAWSRISHKHLLHRTLLKIDRTHALLSRAFKTPKLFSFCNSMQYLVSCFINRVPSNEIILSWHRHYTQKGYRRQTKNKANMKDTRIESNQISLNLAFQNVYNFSCIFHRAGNFNYLRLETAFIFKS